MEEVECYRCGENGHIAPKCGIKREDATCTYSNCSSPNGHLLKACKTRKEEQGKQKKKKKKGKKKEKSKKVESEDEQEDEDESPDGGDSSEGDRPNTPGPSVSKRVILKSKLIKLTKEARDLVKRKTESKGDPAEEKESEVKSEGIKEVIVCKKGEDCHDLPHLPMTISKKDSDKLLICSLLDTGTLTSILSHKVAKELKHKLEDGNHISLKTANGEAMDVKGLSYIYLTWKSCLRRSGSSYGNTRMSLRKKSSKEGQWISLQWN